MSRRAILCALAALLTIAVAVGDVAAQTGQPACTPPSEMQQTLAKTPEPEVLNNVGIWFADHRQYDCAAQAFATSLQRDPQQPPFRRIIFLFGASLFYAGDTKEAAEALQEAERVGYRDQNLYVLLATSLDAQHHTARAVAEWKEALAFDPESPTTLDALSSDLLDLHDYAGVIQLLAATRLREVRTELQVTNLADAYERTGRDEDAANLLEDAVNTYPNSTPLTNHLIAALIRLHREREAALVRKLAQSAAHPAEDTAR